jgi:hypothetical protein
MLRSIRGLIWIGLIPGLVLGLVLALPGGRALALVVPPGQKVACKWGKPQKLDAIPGCGIPRLVHATPPPGVERLMFARDDNPTLKRYMYRARAIGAPVKTFKRMVNVTKTDVVLCPSDFQKARILAFRVVRGKAITARPTCELGPPGAVTAMTPGMTPGSTPGPGMTPGMTPGVTPAMDAMAGRSVTAVIERDSPVGQRDLVKLKRSFKMDSLARLLGLLGLLLGLGATVGVVLLALSVRKRLGRLEARAASSSPGPTKSPTKSPKSDD